MKIGFWLRAWKIELTLIPSLQIKPKKFSAKKYVWHRSLKAKGHGGTVNGTSIYAGASRPKGSLKRCYERFRRTHKKTSVPESLFWCFLVNSAKFVTMPFFTEEFQTCVFKGVQSKSRCDYQQYIPDSAENRSKRRNVNVAKFLRTPILPRFFCYCYFITHIKWDIIISSSMLSFRWDYCWKCEFDTYVKIE